MRFFKVFIFLLLLFAAVAANAQQYWIRQPTPVTAWLYRCAFTDTLNGWAVGDSGIIVHTSNGGENWELQNSTINIFIEDVFFLNKRLGWAIANDYFFEGTTILKTTNGGVKWMASRYPDTTLVLFTVYYLDSLNGYLAGYSGALLKTTDAGNSWSMSSIDTNITSHFPIRRLAFRNLQSGLACGGVIDISAVIWRSTNFGVNWAALPAAPEPLMDIMYLDSQRALACGGDFEYGLNIVRSYDGGRQWTYENPGMFGMGQRLAFRTDYEVWIPLGFSVRWAVSTDTAHTLIEVPAPDSSEIYDAKFADSTHGWAVGNNGAIYKFNPLLIGIKKNQNNLPAENSLSQNYPNPFNPSTVIRFTITKHTRVKITLYDLLGREVRVLLQDIKDPGGYSFNFNASGLSSGVYFYRIEAGRYTETRKMVLMK